MGGHQRMQLPTPASPSATRRAAGVEVVAVAIVFATHSITTDNEAGVATGWLDG
jgi:hypothetical protein